MSILRITIAVFSIIFIICMILVVLAVSGFFDSPKPIGGCPSYFWNPCGITTGYMVAFLAFWPGVISGALALITGFIYFIRRKYFKKTAPEILN